MSILATFASDAYPDKRTKDSFKDQCDINKIIRKAQKTGAVSHLSMYGAEYGDFADAPDLLEAHKRMTRANAIFEALPSEIRREFDQSPTNFFTFVNDPKNRDQLRDLLPRIAEPQNFFPTPGAGTSEPPRPNSEGISDGAAPAAASEAAPAAGGAPVAQGDAAP